VEGPVQVIERVSSNSYIFIQNILIACEVIHIFYSKYLYYCIRIEYPAKEVMDRIDRANNNNKQVQK
jgi:hypothetical protein